VASAFVCETVSSTARKPPPISAGLLCMIVFYRVVDGRGSLSIKATSNVSAAGIIAPKATALPTPMTKRDAVIMGEMTVAID
jgi:hypothetical protein